MNLDLDTLVGILSDHAAAEATRWLLENRP